MTLMDMFYLAASCHSPLNASLASITKTPGKDLFLNPKHLKMPICMLVLLTSDHPSLYQLDQLGRRSASGRADSRQQRIPERSFDYGEHKK